MSLLFFVPSYSFPRISGKFIKTSFLAFSSACQYPPGPILKEVHNVSDKYKPPIKKLHYCIIQAVPYFLFITVQYFIQVLLTLEKSTTKTEAWLSSALSHIELFLFLYYTTTEDLHMFLIIFPCFMLAWDHGLPVQIGKLLPKPLFKNWVWQEPSILLCPIIF